MNIPSFTVPKPIGSVLSVLPQYPHSVAFAQALNLVLGPATLQSEALSPLRGKLLCIRVTDAQVALYVSLGQKTFGAARRSREPDLTLSATAHDFMLLATRKEDPDTLFFSRRLLTEGDTELGLLAKNTLDALDLPPLDVKSFAPGKVLGMIKARLLA